MRTDPDSLRVCRSAARAPWARLSSFLAVLSLALCAVAVAQAPPPPAESPPTIEEVQAKLDAVEALADRSEDEKAVLRDAYKRAIASLAAAREEQQQAAEFQKKIDEAPGRLQAIREELRQPPAEVKIEPESGATLAALEQKLDQAKAEHADARGLVNELQTESTSRTDRRTDLPGLLAGLRRRMEELAAPVTGADPLLDEAERIAVRALRHALEAEATRYEKELASFDARADLLPARRDRALRRAAEAEKRVKEWQKHVDAARARESERAIEEAKQRRVETELKELADENVALTEERSRLTKSLEQASGALAQRRDRLERLTDRFTKVRSRVNLAGLTNAMSVLLRKEYGDLEVTGGFGREQRLRRERISEAQLRQLELEDERYELSADFEARAQEEVDSIDPDGTRADRDELLAAARTLLSKKKEHLDDLLRDYKLHLERLTRLEETTTTYAAAMEEYHEYLQERIFSVRSVDGSLVPTPAAFLQAAVKLVDPQTWAGTPERLGAAVTAASLGQAFSVSALVLVLGLSVLSRRRVRARLQWVNEQVRRIKTDAFKHSIEAFVCTLVLALPAALVMFLVGTALEVSAAPRGLSGAVGAVLVELSPTLLMLVFLRHAARRDGLAGTHFQWADATCRRLGRLIRWFTPAYLVPLGVALVMEPPVATDRDNDSLGRVAFAVAVVVLGVFLRRVLDPKGPVLAPLAARSPSAFVVRFRYAWYVVGLVVPGLLLLLTAVGYDFTANVIHARFLASLQFLLLLVFLYAMLARWLDVARRRVAIEHARRRREAAKAEATAQASGDVPRETAPAFEEVDLPAVNAQTLQLVRTLTLVVVVAGLWGIWAELFPALRVFDRVRIWPSFAVVEDREEGRFPVLEGLAETSPSPTPAAPESRAPDAADADASASGSSSVANGSRAANGSGGGNSGGADDGGAAEGAQLEDALPNVLTLGDLALSLLFLLVTTVAAKNVPGFVEIVFLRRLALDAGARYAVSTIARYVIVIVGVTLAFGALSIGWSNIQWLAAALTFGLGFGLQEIFANFVSGLIMLFERPVRIGDTVSVGGVTGTVARIRMRATTITDYENRELIVPNREFITGQLVNWTLTDSVTREVIKVGISYGSDPVRARDAMLKAARECPFVLDNPAPSVIFREFGDSSLMMNVRVFMASRDDWPQLMDDMHNRLFRACREAGVEIAFPQLDLHLKSGFPPPREPPAE